MASTTGSRAAWFDRGLRLSRLPAQNGPRKAAKSLRAPFNDSLEVMSADDHEQPGAEPAIETRSRRPHRGRIDARNASMAVAGESEPEKPGKPAAAPDDLSEMTT
ncbi:hypothetical protein [Nonomuraea recticatena]